MIGDLKWGKGKYRVSMKTYKYLVSAYLVAALKKDSKGRIGFKTAEELYKEIEKHLPQAVRKKLEKPLKKLIEHVDNEYIVKAFQTSKSGISKKNMRVLIDIKANVIKGGEKLAKQLYIYDSKKIADPLQKGSLKVKDYLKEAKSSALKELNFKSMFKDFSKAKGLGRVIPGINIASKTLSLYDGLNESTKMANKVAALKKDSKGRIGFKTAEELYKEIEKHLPQAVRKKLEKPLKKLIEHVDNEYIVKAFQTSKSGISKKNMRVLIDIKANVIKGGEKLAKQLYIYDSKKIVDPLQKGSLKVKDYLKEAKSSALKELNFKSMFKDFSKAKGLGRVIPGINIASKTLSLYDGLNESTKMANKHKLKGKEKAMSLIGGTAVDLGDMAVTAGAATVGSMAGTWLVGGALAAVTTVLGVATAPVWVTAAIGVGTGVLASFIVSKAIDSTGYKKKMKNAWNSFLEKF